MIAPNFFGSWIYDLSFMDVDKILPFSSTLGWHSLKVNGEVQTRKGLRWIPRHPETRKGVVSDEMLRGVENKGLLYFINFLKSMFTKIHSMVNIVQLEFHHLEIICYFFQPVTFHWF